MTSTEDLKQYAQALANAGHLGPEERQVVMERIDASPYVAKRPSAPAPPASPPAVAVNKRRGITRTEVVIAVATVSVLAAVAILAVTAFSADPIKVSARMVILGADCSESGYSDADQIVVRNPKGEEVAFADLDQTDEGDGHCVYEGSVEIADDAKYFNVGSRSETRSGIRMTRAEIAEGIDISLGDCPEDADDDAFSDCFAWVLTQDTE